MTVAELIQLLEQYDEDAEIRVAFQPSWPLRARVQNVIASDEVVDEDDEDEDPAAADQRGENIVWIAVDQVSQYDENPYAPKTVWR
jgi:hypothetical protein